MLEFLLCLAACQAATLQEPNTLHLQAVPAEVTGLVIINDMPEMIAKGSKNAWYQYLLDPELAEFRNRFRPARAEFGIGGDRDGVQLAQDLAHSIQALTVYVTPSEHSPVGCFGAALHVRDEHEPLHGHFKTLQTRLAEHAPPEMEPWRETKIQVYTDLPVPGESAPLFTMAIVELDNLYLFAGADTRAADRDAVVQLAKDSIDRVLDPELPNLLRNERFLDARRMPGAKASLAAPGHLEGFVDVGSLTRFIPTDHEVEPIIKEVVCSLSSIPWIHFSTSLGEGEELRSRFGFRYDPSTLLGRIVDLSRPAPRGLLKLMPADSATVSIGAFDMQGFVDLMLESVDLYAPDGTTDKMQGLLSLAEGQLGLNPIDDFLRAFNGKFAAFQRFGVDGKRQPSPADRMWSTLDTMILGLNDGETFSSHVEDVLGRVGFEDHVEIDPFEGIDVFSSNKGVSISWIVTHEFIAISGDRRNLEHLIRASNAPLPSILDEEQVSLALKDMDSSTMFSVSDSAAVLKVLGEVFDNVSSVSGAIPQVAAINDWLAAFGSSGALAPELIDRYIDGHLYSSWEVKDGRVWLRSWGR